MQEKKGAGERRFRGLPSQPPLQEAAWALHPSPALPPRVLWRSQLGGGCHSALDDEVTTLLGRPRDGQRIQVGSSSLTRDGTQAPCTGSMEP